MANAVKNTQSPAVDSAERRAFYRVNDAVALRVTVLDDDALTQFQDALEQRRSSGQDTDSGAHAHVIWRNLEENYPDIAAYLGKLEQRIDALQTQIGNLSDAAPTRSPTHSARQSRSGTQTTYTGGAGEIRLRLAIHRYSAK